MGAIVYNLLQVVLFTLAGLYQAIRQDFNPLEIAILAGLAFAVWRRGFSGRLRFLSSWESALGRLARRPARACAAVGCAAIVVRLALIPVLPIPKPVVSDELSHLLLADTLLHGRIANPTHPMWPHFESLQIIQQPHYVSNYFPGHAAVLAAARLLTGNPWFGVLLLSGICCAVISWALAGWMPMRWALFGGVLAMLRFSIGSYWVNSFYGGFLPAIGGALVAGAYPRLRERTSLGMSTIFGSGLAVLALTRPYEGLLFSLPFLIALVRSWLRWRFVLPVLVIVGMAVAGLGLYFKGITGSPLKTTYSISQQAYGWPASIGWAKPVSMEHRSVEMHRYYLYELEEHGKVDSVLHFITYLAIRIQEYWRFFIGPMLTIPLLFFAAVWRGGHLRVLILALAAAFLAVMFEGASMSHYLAPATCAIVAVIVECLRRLRVWRFQGRRTGLLLARASPVVIMIVLGVRIAAENVGLPYTQKLNYQSWCCKQQGDYSRHRLTGFLNAQPGKHLVIVVPKQSEFNLLQWIYNDADIDGSRIVWARDMGPQENAKLVEYFRDRTVWRVDPNVVDPQAVLIPPTTTNVLSNIRR
jgi:hypothetical protein